MVAKMAIVRASFGLWLALTSTTLVAGTGSKNNSPITPTELGQRQHYPEAGQTAFYVPTHGMVQGNDPTIFQQPNWPEPKDPCSYGYMNIPSNDLDEDQPGSDPDESIEAEPSQLFYEQPPIAWPETQSFGLDASFVENSLLSGPFINHSPAEGRLPDYPLYTNPKEVELAGSLAPDTNIQQQHWMQPQEYSPPLPQEPQPPSFKESPELKPSDDTTMVESHEPAKSSDHGTPTSANTPGALNWKAAKRAVSAAFYSYVSHIVNRLKVEIKYLQSDQPKSNSRPAFSTKRRHRAPQWSRQVESGAFLYFVYWDLVKQRFEVIVPYPTVCDVCPIDFSLFHLVLHSNLAFLSVRSIETSASYGKLRDYVLHVRDLVNKRKAEIHSLLHQIEAITPVLPTAIESRWQLSWEWESCKPWGH